MKSFALSLLAVALVGPVLAAPTLTGRTASGRDVFAEGERPELHLTVTGLKPDIAGPDVLVEVFDARGRSCFRGSQKTLADRNGNDTVRIQNAPRGVGRYRVEACLSTGETLSVPWSGAGTNHFSYVVAAQGAMSDTQATDDVSARRAKAVVALTAAKRLKPASGRRAIVLRGDTSEPRESVFFPGEKVALRFHLSGLEPLAYGPDLQVQIVDERGRELKRFVRQTVGDRNGCDEIAIDDPPADRLGYYRVNARLADGTLLTEPWATRRDGMMTYAVVRDPATRETVDEEVLRFFHGRDERLTGPMPRSDLQKGLKGWGSEARWGSFDAAGPGSYAANTNRAALLLSRHGSILGGSFSGWTKADRDRCFRTENLRSGVGALTDEGAAAFERSLRAWVTEYRRQFADRRPRTYEVSSEVFRTDNGARSLEDIIRYYEITYKVVRELDPEGIVCGAGYGYGKYTTAFLQAGLGKWIDALTLHPYFNPDPIEPNGIVDRVRDGYREACRYAGRKLDVFATEFGFATLDREPLEDVQMKHIVRQSAIYVGEGMRSISLFTRSDYRLEPGMGYSYNLWLGRNHEKKNDYQAPKTSPKQVYPAMAQLCDFLCNSRSIGAIPYLGETVWGYAFRHAKTGRVNLALWDWSGVPSRHVLPLGRPSVAVRDAMGNETRLVCGRDGCREIELTDMPTYVYDVDPSVWAAPDGERARREAAYEQAKEKNRRAKGVEIVSIRPALGPDGGTAVAVTVRDISGRRNEGTLRLRRKGLVGTSGETAYAVDADRETTVVMPLDDGEADPLAAYETVATATMRDGRQAERTDNLNLLVVPRFTGDWRKVRTLDLPAARHCLDWPAYFGGAKDFTARVQLAYDDDGLLFRFEREDDCRVVPQTGANLCAGDAVQIRLAKAFRYERTSNVYLDEIAEAQTAYSFGFAADGPALWRHVSFDHQGRGGGQGGGRGSRHPVGPVANGADGYCLDGGPERLPDGRWRTVSEIRIPWHAINCMGPKAGDCHALAFRLYDHDAKPNGWWCGHGAFGFGSSFEYGAFVLGGGK